MTAIETAIRKLTPPTQAELARRIRVKPQEVNRWVKRGWAAPKHCPAIERATGVSTNKLIAEANGSAQQSQTGQQ